MTNQEAIEDIRNNIKPIVGGKSLDMAIEALEERKTGRWIYDGYDGHVRCASCSKIYDWDTQAQYYNYCPNCGAKMEVEHENNHVHL